MSLWVQLNTAHCQLGEQQRPGWASSSRTPSPAPGSWAQERASQELRAEEHAPPTQPRWQPDL